MAISILNRNSGQDANGGTGSIAVAYGVGNTIGSTSIAIVLGTDTTNALFASEFADVTDSNGNSYKKIFHLWDSFSQLGCKAYAAYGIKPGANTVSLPNDHNNPGSLFIYEVSGLGAQSNFDKSKSASQSATNTFDTAAITQITRWPNELLLGAFAQSGTVAFTAGAGYSNLQTQNVTGMGQTATEEQIVSAFGKYNATATTTGTPNGFAVLLSFADTVVRYQINNTGLRPHPFSPGLAR